MGARAPSEAAAAVARAFESASCRFVSDVASRSPRTARGSGAVGPDPGGTGDSGDDIVEAPRRFEGDAPAEPPDASGSATASFASPGGHHVGFIQYHSPVAASAEGVYAPALERARRAFGTPSSASDAESPAEGVHGSRAASFARGVRDEGLGSRSEVVTRIVNATDERDSLETDARSRGDTTSGSSSGGIFLDTAHAFGSRAFHAEPARSFRWRSLFEFWSLIKKLARLPLDAQTRFAGAGDVSLWDLEIGVKLGGGSPSVVAEAERQEYRSSDLLESSRPKNVHVPAREKLRRFLSRRFAKWNPSSLELETRATAASDSSERAVDKKKVILSDSARTTRLRNDDANDEEYADDDREKANISRRLDSSFVVSSPPSAFLCAHLDGWGDRGLEFELAGGKFVRRKDDVTGFETATRTRRSWTAAFDLKGNSKPTVEWVDVTEKDEIHETEKKRKDIFGDDDDDFIRSTTTRVRLAYRSPLKFAGLHPVIRALEMGRHRHLVNDRAAVEIRRVRSPWERRGKSGENAESSSPSRENSKTTKTKKKRKNVSDVLDARLAAEAKPSLLRMTTRWRKAQTFETKSSDGETFTTTYAFTHEGVDTLVPRVSHRFAQKASLEANVVACVETPRPKKKHLAVLTPASVLDDGASRSWRGSVRLSSLLRSAREMPSLSFSCAREGLKWTVSGEARFSRGRDDSSEADASEIAFRARREFFSVGASDSRDPNGGFVEVRLSLSGGDARAFAEFATSAASSASQ